VNASLLSEFLSQRTSVSAASQWLCALPFHFLAVCSKTGKKNAVSRCFRLSLQHRLLLDVGAQLWITLQGINRLGKGAAKPGTLRPADPNRFKTEDFFSVEAEDDPEYLRRIVEA
jgi:hypothetical protein